jgi:hypothetical protein
MALAETIAETEAIALAMKMRSTEAVAFDEIPASALTS